MDPQYMGEGPIGQGRGHVPPVGSVLLGRINDQMMHMYQVMADGAKRHLV